MKTEMIQLKGKAHKQYIFNMAMELWEKAGWVDTELDDHLRQALQIHRETVHKAVLNAEAECNPPVVSPKVQYRSCSRCGKIPNKNDELCTGLCPGCWTMRYIGNRT